MRSAAKQPAFKPCGTLIVEGFVMPREKAAGTSGTDVDKDSAMAKMAKVCAQGLRAAAEMEWTSGADEGEGRRGLR
jgi:hypothetical protein